MDTIKYVFIDMDNTIAENITCDDISFYPGLYINKRPIKIVIDAINKIYKDSFKVIISKTEGGEVGEIEKMNWLSKYFPDADLSIFVKSNETKRKYIEELMKYYEFNSNECLLIDDKKEILQDCKTLGIAVKYPQQLICDYEMLNKRK